MLDVHPPHESAHSVKDFSIHILTIVVGLLIAIGLEQTVEYLHHRSELRETREALAREREENIESFAQNTQGLRANIAVLRNNLLVLVYVHDHPGVKRADLPGVMRWDNFAIAMTDIAWRTAQTSNIIPLMSRQEVSEHAQLYEGLSSLNDAEAASWKATSDAQMFTLRDPDPSHLHGVALDQEIDRMQQALIAKYRVAIEMQGLSRVDKGFRPAPTGDDIANMSLLPALTSSQKAELEPAIRQTQARLAATPQPPIE